LTINIRGKVIRGDGYGKKLGFPTANVDRRQYVRDGLKIKLGIYAGVVQARGLLTSAKLKAGQGPALQEQKYKAAIVIGPVDHRGLPKLEAHLIGFKGNLYGKKITITLQKYLRQFKKFKSELELIRQIKRDIQRIREREK
jgi:riboflavin kinase / FMN adenylyltransferase